jgi:hypothetical protein
MPFLARHVMAVVVVVDCCGVAAQGGTSIIRSLSVAFLG